MANMANKTDKLVLKYCNTAAARDGTTTIAVCPATYQKLELLKWKTGMSIKRLSETLLDYAIKNTIIEGSDEDEETE